MNISRVVIIQLIAAAAGAVIARRKGRNWLIWAILGFIFPLSILILLVLPPVLARGLTKQCPECGSVIPQGSTVCKRCRQELPIEMTRCPGCDKFVPEGSRCPECGHALR